MPVVSLHAIIWTAPSGFPELTKNIREMTRKEARGSHPSTRIVSGGRNVAAPDQLNRVNLADRTIDQMSWCSSLRAGTMYAVRRSRAQSLVCPLSTMNSTLSARPPPPVTRQVVRGWAGTVFCVQRLNTAARNIVGFCPKLLFVPDFQVSGPAAQCINNQRAVYSLRYNPGEPWLR